MGLPGLHDSSDDTSADALNACPVDFSSRCRGAADQLQIKTMINDLPCETPNNRFV